MVKMVVGESLVSSAVARLWQPHRRHLCVLHEAQRVLELHDAPYVAARLTPVDLGHELERIAQALAADTQPVEIGGHAAAPGSSGRLHGGLVPVPDQAGHDRDRGRHGRGRSP